MGLWATGGIIGLRSAKIISGTVSGWKNTFIFVFNSSKECVLAIEIHYAKSFNLCANAVLDHIETVVSSESNLDIK